MEKFSILSSQVIPIPINDIDTDQIIPARFLKVIDKAGLGPNLFADWRYNADGSIKRDFVLNKSKSLSAKILLAGKNFGCGSSREHAPWALMAFGFRAIIAISFADIFRNNALKNSLLPVKIDSETNDLLFKMLSENPQVMVTIDLVSQTLTLPDGRTSNFPIDGFSKNCLLKGIDELGYLLSFTDRITEYEQTHGF